MPFVFISMQLAHQAQSIHTDSHVLVESKDQHEEDRTSLQQQDSIKRYVRQEDQDRDGELREEDQKDAKLGPFPQLELHRVKLWPFQLELFQPHCFLEEDEKTQQFDFETLDEDKCVV